MCWVSGLTLASYKTSLCRPALEGWTPSSRLCTASAFIISAGRHRQDSDPHWLALLLLVAAYLAQPSPFRHLFTWASSRGLILVSLLRPPYGRGGGLEVTTVTHIQYFRIPRLSPVLLLYPPTPQTG
jgi:hypothetical protein